MMLNFYYNNCKLSITGVHATITFQPDTEQCLDELVEYQCTVNGTVPPALTLTWRILDDNGMIGSTSYSSPSLDGAPRLIGGVFTVEQLQQSPIISNISFTVQSNINGYTIQCEDSNTLTTENLIINIAGMSISIIINVNFITYVYMYVCPLVYMCNYRCTCRVVSDSINISASKMKRKEIILSDTIK